MSSGNVNYSLKHKGVRLIPRSEAVVKGKNGKERLNPKYYFVGRIDTKTSNIIVTDTEKKHPSYKGDFSELNRIAKNQTVKYFYNEKGKRNKRYVAYYGIEKDKTQPNSKKRSKK